MILRFTVSVALVFITNISFGQDNEALPIELEVLQGSIGVWDASFEVWSQGPDAEPMKFKGVETNRAHGKYWIASDLETNFGNQTMLVHSIIGYDLDEKQLVGKVIDDGPYAASMTGEYDQESSTVTWMTKAKGPDGSSIVQRTTLTQKSKNERLLVLSVPGEEEGEFTKFMQITFIKRD